MLLSSVLSSLFFYCCCCNPQRDFRAGFVSSSLSLAQLSCAYLSYGPLLWAPFLEQTFSGGVSHPFPLLFSIFLFFPPFSSSLSSFSLFWNSVSFASHSHSLLLARSLAHSVRTSQQQQQQHTDKLESSFFLLLLLPPLFKGREKRDRQGE